MVKKVIKKKPPAKPKVKTVAAKSSGHSQSQNITINLTKPSVSSSVKKYVPVKEQPKQFLPMMPAFNINPFQPKPETDLAKLVGLLIPKKQTESTLGSAIPIKNELPIKKTIKIGELINPKETPSLGDAIDATIVEKAPPIPDEMFFETEPQIESASQESSIIETIKPPKIPKKEKYDIRYQKAFGEAYSGSNIKQKDYEAMIREREQINKMNKPKK